MLQLQQLHKEAGAYLGDLDAIHALLQQLVGKCMVDEQPKIEQVGATAAGGGAQHVIVIVR